MADEIIPVDDPSEGVREEREPEYVELGQWYWIRDKDGWGDDAPERDFLACVMHVGTNYVKLQSPPEGKHDSGHTWRVHLDDVHEELTPEPNAHDIIKGNVEKYRRLAAEKMGKVQEEVARLGMGPKGELEAQESSALTTVASQGDVDDYRKALVKAKTDALPALFKEVEEAHEAMACWMKAPSLEAKAKVGLMKKVVGKIDDQIFTVDLYAGLSEEVAHFAEGKPAPANAKLHVMQRRHYMDEECLANYMHGGMDYKNVEDFDEWMAMPENRDRLLPFPRTVAAFRVRRRAKDRSEEDLDLSPFIRILTHQGKDEADKTTYLYIRNGENLHRLTCEHDFGEKLFPDKAIFKAKRLWWDQDSHRGDRFITDDDYKVRKAEHARLEPLVKAARKAERKADKELDAMRDKEKEEKGDDYRRDDSPELKELCKKAHRLWCEKNSLEKERRKNDVSSYEPFDPTSVYYDDMNDQLEEVLKQHNRVVYILQGLFDRSTVFHPHPPVKLWTPEGSAVIKLVRDEDHALAPADMPDIEAYLAENRRHLAVGCHTIGQEDAWAEREAERENRRSERSWTRDRTHHRRFHPYGDPGPGYIAEVLDMQPRAKRCTYRWTRERQTSGWVRGEWKRYGDPIDCSIRVDPDRLFVVEAYEPGDYKRFFADPRTRMEYLEWAPLLLAAEEWHAGNMKEGVEHAFRSLSGEEEVD